MPRALLNPQTTLLCERLGIDDPLSLLLGNKQRTAASPRVNQVMSPTISESELNITMETSKLSTNPDEVDLSDDENPDIIMEMKFTPDSPSNPEYVLSPIRREGTATGDSPQPYTSSPVHSKESRPGLVLSNPKIGESSEMAKTSACDSSSTTSSLSESESSPRRSPQAKRLNEEKEGAQVEAGSSSTSSSGSSKIKKLKRRNQAMYSSTEEEL